MDFSIKGGKPETVATDCLVVPVVEASLAGTVATQLDQASEGRLQRVLDSNDLGKGCGRTLLLHDLPGIKARRVLLVQCGSKPLDAASFRKVIRSAASALARTACKQTTFCLEDHGVEGRDAAWHLREAATETASESYRFHDYLSEPGEDRSVRLRKVQFLQRATGAQREQALQQAAATAAGVNYCRTLGNLPGNVCHPSYLEQEARKLGRDCEALKVSVLNEKRMASLGMGAFLSVTAGSEQPAKLIVMEYRGGKRNSAPVALVGKGITFDTGGISLKPGPGMDEMKFDMCGAASVFGTMRAIIDMGLPINVVALVAAAENMPSGAASRPGDIVRTMSGQTVEILNTDAEGRLVLCDTLTYAERFKPAAVVDVATLTGACVVALGSHASGLFSNDESLASSLLASGETSGDRAWRLPLWDDYQEQLRSNFADMANVGGREAGSVTAACFLSRFADKYPWAHLDVAGSAWHSGARKGATGRPVRLLVDWLQQRAD